MIATRFPRLRLRDPAIDLVELPWELPLADWPADRLAFRFVPVGPSRHLVRFLISNGILYALKELPLEAARREYGVLLHLENLRLPTVEAAGVEEAPERSSAILATRFLGHSLQYRRLMMRLPPTSGSYRERLLDAMAFLLVDLHRAGVFWGDCSLANTLFRRDGDRIKHTKLHDLPLSRAGLWPAHHKKSALNSMVHGGGSTRGIAPSATSANYVQPACF